MTLTPNEARELLAAFGKDTSADNDLAEIYLWWSVQAEIMKGEHATELADLHARIVAGDDAALERRDQLLEAIAEKHRARIAQEGVPESWQR